MIKPGLPAREAERLAALRDTTILDTAPEVLFDDLTRIAAIVCEVPTALVTLIDEDRQWFKSRVGFEESETRREDAFCAHAILAPEELLEVPNASEDMRFVGNPLVTTPGGIRFYAGAPILSAEGDGFGTVCVIDSEPRELTTTQREVLAALARQASAHLEQRRVAGRLRAALAEVKTLNELLPICTFCHRVREDEGYWSDLNAYLREHAGSQLSHALCPECMTTRFRDVLDAGEGR
jgi:GAF domain-containing protein